MEINQGQCSPSDLTTAWKVSKYGVFSGPYFPHSDRILRDTGSLRIQSKWGKIRTRKNSVFGHFSGSKFSYLFISFIPISHLHLFMNTCLYIFHTVEISRFRGDSLFVTQRFLRACVSHVFMVLFVEMTLYGFPLDLIYE